MAKLKNRKGYLRKKVTLGTAKPEERDELAMLEGKKPAAATAAPASSPTPAEPSKPVPMGAPAEGAAAGLVVNLVGPTVDPAVEKAKLEAAEAKRKEIAVKAMRRREGVAKIVLTIINFLKKCDPLIDALAKEYGTPIMPISTIIPYSIQSKAWTVVVDRWGGSLVDQAEEVAQDAAPFIAIGTAAMTIVPAGFYLYKKRAAMKAGRLEVVKPAAAANAKPADATPAEPAKPAPVAHPLSVTSMPDVKPEPMRAEPIKRNHAPKVSDDDDAGGMMIPVDTGDAH